MSITNKDLLDIPRIENLLANVRHYLQKSAELSKDGPMVDDSNTETGALRWALYHTSQAISAILEESATAATVQAPETTDHWQMYDAMERRETERLMQTTPDPQPQAQDAPTCEHKRQRAVLTNGMMWCWDCGALSSGNGDGRWTLPRRWVHSC